MTGMPRLAARVQAWASGRTGYDLPVLPVAGLMAAHMRAPTGLEPAIYSPIYCLVLQGRKSIRFDGRTIRLDPESSVIVSHCLPVVSGVDEASLARPYLALALQLDPDLLRTLEAPSEADHDTEEAASIRAGHATPTLLDAMARLFALTSEPDAAPVLAPLLRQEIHFRLLRSDHGAMLRRLTRTDSHASRIARAIAHIHRSFAEPLAVADLAAIAGMSLSSLHEHFRAITATTPLQFQKQIRLTEARRLLLAGNHSVGSAARMVGYESPTQFSREYSRTFGKSPSVDRAAA